MLYVQPPKRDSDQPLITGSEVKPLFTMTPVKWVCALLGVTCGAWLAWVNPKPIDKPTRTCLTNVRLMALGSLMYADQNDGTLPDAGYWMDAIQPNVPSTQVFRDPVHINKGEYGYAFREKASKQRVSQIKDPAQFQLIFDSLILKRNASSDLSSIPPHGRHAGGNCIATLDGHSRWIRP